MRICDTPRSGSFTGTLARLGLGLLLAAAAASGSFAQTPKRVYIALDDHTDLFWTADDVTYRQAFLDTLDYYLNLADTTAGEPDDFQSRWNCDGSYWMWTYEKNRPAADFQRLIGRIRDGHIGVPLNVLANHLGGAQAEAILRGMYYPGRIERRYGLRFPLVYAMENQTLPLGLSSLWAGSGGRYSWRGICACFSLVPSPGDREHDIYWYTGLDGSRILMKWNSMLGQNTSLGGYAEARDPAASIDFVTTNASSDGFQSRYPYDVIGAFGKGWDDLETLTNSFVTVAKAKTDATRSVRVSNEEDFFRDFEATYPASALPTVTQSFGNEWELPMASLAEVFARVKRSVENLRSAEALATVVSLQNGCFMNGRETARDQAYMDIGMTYEHDYGMFARSGAIVQARIDWQRQLAAEIDVYVTTLKTDATAALGSMIPANGTAPRFFVFNPLSWSRTDAADLPYAGPLPAHVVDLQTGLDIPSQMVTIDGQARLRMLATNVPSVGYNVYEVRSGAGQFFTDAASVAGSTLQNALYSITLAPRGAITSLIDKTRSNREFVRVIGGLAMNDLGSGVGSIQVENAGPVSVTLLADVSSPLAHTTRLTLLRGLDRIDIRNDINQNFSDWWAWVFGFNIDAPDVHHEELGAILRARLINDGGHYATRNARYDWLTLNHFVDIGGSTGGMTLSDADTFFMKLGSSTVGTLDVTTPQIWVLAGGLVTYGSEGLPNQGGDTHFLQRLALRPRDIYDPAAAMRFSLEHQNPLVAGPVTGGGALPETTFSFLSVSDPNVLLWALKPSEEGPGQGIVTRLWNLSSAASEAIVSFSPGPISGGYTATHIETPTGPLSLAGGSLDAVFTGQQMRTFVSRIDAQTPLQSPLLQVSRSGPDILLSWTPTGQGCFSAVKSTTPQFSGATTVYSGPGTNAVNPGGSTGPDIVFYTVK